MAFKKMLLPSFALLAVASVLVGCAQTPPADVPARATATSSMPTTATPSADVSSVGYRVTVPAHVISWPDANATLTPLPNPSTSLVSAATAFTAISAGFTNVAASGASSGQTTAALYSYTNSAYGTIRADGTVKLTYTDAPVWVFLIPLSRSLDLSQGALGSPPEHAGRNHCSYYYLIDATTGKFLTSSEECRTQTPMPLATIPAK